MDLFTNNSVEKEYEKLVTWYENSRTEKKATGIQQVLQVMLDKPEKIWWWSWEFIGLVNSKGGFLSHRSPARASDLAIHYPEFVEDRKIGRFSVYRLKIENKKDIIDFLKCN